jgi:hypothetical protein
VERSRFFFEHLPLQEAEVRARVAGTKNVFAQVREAGVRTGNFNNQGAEAKQARFAPWFFQWFDQSL